MSGCPRLCVELKAKCNAIDWESLQIGLHGRRFFSAGPSLTALEDEQPCILLIDELDKSVAIDQTNNSCVFPGLALAVIASEARHVSDGMISAAAKTLAAPSPSRKDTDSTRLPPESDSRNIALTAAQAVGRQAMDEGTGGQDGSRFFSR